jgi:2-oxo-4-hydroxy-4-carboxy-5-ureidoimidazoline decarboxylase
LNASTESRARADLLRCCHSRRWVEVVAAARPFADDAALWTVAERAWWALGPEDWREAFAAHPRIGERGSDAWARVEQAGVDAGDEGLRRALAAGNAEYERRFGQVFLICATGRSGAEILAELRRRLAHAPDVELREAAGEQLKITRLRLERLVAS